MPLFRGRLPSNQDVPDIERKRGQKNYLKQIVWLGNYLGSQTNTNFIAALKGSALKVCSEKM
jgi:hypothetical protein